MTFELLLSTAPSIVLRKLEQLKFLRERPDYHPEKSAHEHIRIVTERLIPLGNIDLILSGILHDICKFDTVRENPKTGWPTSPGHDQAAHDLITRNEDIQKWISSLGADVKIVSEICKFHMRFHVLPEMREAKREAQIEEWKNLEIWEHLQVFGQADNMLAEFNVQSFPICQ
jgi:hypothetical protein